MKMEMENDGKNKGLSLNYFKRRKAKITYSKEDHLILFLFIKSLKEKNKLNSFALKNLTNILN